MITYGGPSLKNARKAAGFKTAREFAVSVGIPPTTYARYEQKPNHIPMVTAINLADYLDVPLDKIVGRIYAEGGDVSVTGFTCPECGNTESFDASTVILNGTTHITKDGWDYFSYPNDVMLDSGASITCCECGFEHVPEKFYE